LDGFLYYLIADNHSLDDSVNWYWHFNWNNGWSVDLNDFINFNNLSDNSVNKDFLWNLYFSLNYLLNLLLNDFHFFLDSLNGNNFFNNLFDCSVDLVVDVLDYFDLNYFFLDDWHLDNLLDFSDLLDLDNSINDFLYDLRNFNNLFNDSRYHNYFFNNLFDFYDLGYFNHLFNDLVDGDSHLFDSFDGPWDLNNLLDYDSDWVVLSNVDVDWLLNLNNVVNLNDLVDVSGDLHDSGNLDSLDADLGNNFRDSQDLLLVEWHLNSSVNYLFNLFYQSNWSVDNLFYLFNSVSVNNLLLDNLNFLDCWYFYSHLN